MVRVIRALSRHLLDHRILAIDAGAVGSQDWIEHRLLGELRPVAIRRERLAADRGDDLLRGGVGADDDRGGWRLAGSGVGDGEAGGGDDDGWRSHADSSFERLFFVCFAAFVAFMYSRLRLAIVSGSGEKSKTSTETHLS